MTLLDPDHLRAAFLSMAVMASAPAAAQSVVIATGQTVTTPLLLGNPGDQLIIEGGGTLDVAGFGMNAVEGTASDQSFHNAGSILLDDDGSSDGSALRSKGDNATIVNDGAIEAINIAIGIRSDGNAATITNNATIDADSYGIRSTGGEALIANAGTITALDHGIRSDGDNATIVNRGTVLGSPQGTVVDIHGIRSGGDFATITNVGHAFGDSDGLFSIGDNATIINHGTLDGGTSGLGSQGNHAIITNYGTITGDTRAIGIVGVGSELILMPGSVVDGLVQFDGIDEVLTLPIGQSRFLSYGGAFETLNSAAPFVNDPVNGRVITIDPTAFAAPGIWLQTLTEVAHQAARDGIVGQGGGRTSPVGSGQTTGDDGSIAWAGGFGGYQTQPGNEALIGMDQRYGGGIAGGGAVHGGQVFGAFAGGSHSRFDSDNGSQTVEVNSAFGGVYSARSYGDTRFVGALMGGYARFSSERMVANNLISGGFETATADYDGYFLSPSLSATRSLGARAQVGLSARYAALFVESYQEDGSMAGLDVDSRTVQVASLRAEAGIRAAEWRSARGRTSINGWLGIDGQFNLGGDSVTGAVSGLPVDFSASYSDAAVIGFAGLGLNHRSRDDSWFLDANVEGRYGTGRFWEVRATGRLGRHF